MREKWFSLSACVEIQLIKVEALLTGCRTLLDKKIRN